MARRGWRRSGPGFVAKDRAVRFEILLDEAISTCMLSWADAERITGISCELLRQRIEDVVTPPIYFESGEEKSETLPMYSQEVSVTS